MTTSQPFLPIEPADEVRTKAARLRARLDADDYPGTWMGQREREADERSWRACVRWLGVHEACPSWTATP